MKAENTSRNPKTRLDVIPGADRTLSTAKVAPDNNIRAKINIHPNIKMRLLEFPSCDPHGSDNKPVRSGTDEVERITGDQRQDLLSACLQYRDIIRTHDRSGYNFIAVLAKQRADGNDVVRPDVFERPEERVAMPGNTDVALLSRECCAGNMADRGAGGPSRWFPR